MFLCTTACAPQTVEPMQLAEVTKTETIQGASISSQGRSNPYGDRSPLIIVMKNDKKIDVSLDDIYPDEIQSVSVIKKPQSLIPYGEQAKYGVVIVTLKN